jgi:NADPH:quinone reductase-like Zn-dependent oxidoreductase
MPRTFAKLVELYDEGRIDPLIFREPLPLAEAANALTMLGARQTWGKVIIDPAR